MSQDIPEGFFNPPGSCFRSKERALTALASRQGLYSGR
jgi:hypothetical protein